MATSTMSAFAPRISSPSPSRSSRYSASSSTDSKSKTKSPSTPLLRLDPNVFAPTPQQGVVVKSNVVAEGSRKEAVDLNQLRGEDQKESPTQELAEQVAQGDGEAAAISIPKTTSITLTTPSTDEAAQQSTKLVESKPHVQGLAGEVYRAPSGSSPSSSAGRRTPMARQVSTSSLLSASLRMPSNSSIRSSTSSIHQLPSLFAPPSLAAQAVTSSGSTAADYGHGEDGVFDPTASLRERQEQQRRRRLLRTASGGRIPTTTGEEDDLGEGTESIAASSAGRQEESLTPSVLTERLERTLAGCYASQRRGGGYASSIYSAASRWTSGWTPSFLQPTTTPQAVDRSRPKLGGPANSWSGLSSKSRVVVATTTTVEEEDGKSQQQQSENEAARGRTTKDGPPDVMARLRVLSDRDGSRSPTPTMTTASTAPSLKRTTKRAAGSLHLPLRMASASSTPRRRRSPVREAATALAKATSTETAHLTSSSNGNAAPTTALAPSLSPKRSSLKKPSPPSSVLQSKTSSSSLRSVRFSPTTSSTLDKRKVHSNPTSPPSADQFPSFLLSSPSSSSIKSGLDEALASVEDRSKLKTESTCFGKDCRVVCVNAPVDRKGRRFCSRECRMGSKGVAASG